MKTVYLVRHSGPFVKLQYKDAITWEEQNRNMILSVEAEEKSKVLSNINELKNIDVIYSSNSARAIATAKYIAHNNNLDINIENSFNERRFGVKYIDDLSEDFIIEQFKNEDYKLFGGESLNDVENRIKETFDTILNSNDEKIAIVLHGIVLMVFIKLYCKVEYDGKSFKILNDDQIIYDDMIKSPDVFKLTIDDKRLINLENISL